MQGVCWLLSFARGTAHGKAFHAERQDTGHCKLVLHAAAARRGCGAPTAAKLDRKIAHTFGDASVPAAPLLRHACCRPAGNLGLEVGCSGQEELRSVVKAQRLACASSSRYKRGSSVSYPRTCTFSLGHMWKSEEGVSTLRKPALSDSGGRSSHTPQPAYNCRPAAAAGGSATHQRSWAAPAVRTACIAQ